MIRLGARAVGSAALAITTVLSSLALAALPATAQAARPLTRGFVDDVWFDPSPGGPQWVPKTVATGAKRVQIEVDWKGIEPTAPGPGTDPSNPNGPQYNFASLDARIREFAGSGISPILMVLDAPAWAEGAGGSAQQVAEGAWKPNPTAYGQFATALARRYSGHFPDPLNPGHTLARVTYYQAWGEPNLGVHIAPQWVKRGRKYVVTGPVIYRSLLNAFYSGIKSVNRSDVVATAGLAPYGAGPTANPVRMRPALFLRTMLCLNGRTALKPMPCSNPAHYDALAMDPYEVAGPTTHALNPDDVSAPDLTRLTKIETKALRTGRLLPRGHKQLWVTEFGYDSNPPNPFGVSTKTQARWLDESFYIFWSQGVSTVLWYLVRDQAGHNYSSSYFSGVYFYNGKKKPSFEAYRFPFVVMPAGKSARVWGIAPVGGRVAIQRKKGRSFKTLFRVRASAGGVFVRKVPASLRGNFRAVVGGQTSLTWRR